MPGFSLDRRHLLAAGTALLATTALTAPLAAQDRIKVAAIYTIPVEQKWVGRIHEAANAAAEAGEIDYVDTENVANTDYPRVMREYAEQGVELIIGEAFGVEAESREVAADYPDTAFLMGSSFMPDEGLPNFSVFDNYIQDASYLTGIIAGAMTETGNIGMVGGFPIPEVNRLMHAFMAGALEANPEIKFQVSFIGSWFDPPKAKEIAFAMIEGGADMLYAERFGVADAAKEKGALAIGNVVDSQPEYPDTVVASALWHFEPTLNAAVAAIRDGTFTAENYGVYSFMNQDGSSLAPLGTFADKVPQAALDLVATRSAEIKSGAFTVDIDDTEPKPN
ncbi:MAG: BMP family protein [Qingshengfaniella sp.]